MDTSFWLKARGRSASPGSALEVPGAVPSGGGPDALATDASSASVARRLVVAETTLRNWVKAHQAEEARAANPLSVSPSEFEELRRLRLEVKELKMEKEILREAAAYSARETIRSAAPVRRGAPKRLRRQAALPGHRGLTLGFSPGRPARPRKGRWLTPPLAKSRPGLQPVTLHLRCSEVHADSSGPGSLSRARGWLASSAERAWWVCTLDDAGAGKHGDAHTPTSSTGTSTPPVLTRSGPPTSPSSAPARDGSTWPLCSTFGPGACSAGRWAPRPRPSSSLTPW